MYLQNFKNNAIKIFEWVVQIKLLSRINNYRLCLKELYSKRVILISNITCNNSRKILSTLIEF